MMSLRNVHCPRCSRLLQTIIQHFYNRVVCFSKCHTFSTLEFVSLCHPFLRQETFISITTRFLHIIHDDGFSSRQQDVTFEHQAWASIKTAHYYQHIFFKSLSAAPSKAARYIVTVNYTFECKSVNSILCAVWFVEPVYTFQSNHALDWWIKFDSITHLIRKLKFYLIMLTSFLWKEMIILHD